MNMNVGILKKSHANVNFMRKDLLRMDIGLNISVHILEENHSNAPSVKRAFAESINLTVHKCSHSLQKNISIFPLSNVIFYI